MVRGPALEGAGRGRGCHLRPPDWHLPTAPAGSPRPPGSPVTAPGLGSDPALLAKAPDLPHTGRSRGAVGPESWRPAPATASALPRQPWGRKRSQAPERRLGRAWHPGPDTQSCDGPAGCWETHEPQFQHGSHVTAGFRLPAARPLPPPPPPQGRSSSSDEGGPLRRCKARPPQPGSHSPARLQASERGTGPNRATRRCSVRPEAGERGAPERGAQSGLLPGRHGRWHRCPAQGTPHTHPSPAAHLAAPTSAKLQAKTSAGRDSSHRPRAPRNGPLSAEGSPAHAARGLPSWSQLRVHAAPTRTSGPRHTRSCPTALSLWSAPRPAAPGTRGALTAPWLQTPDALRQATPGHSVPTRASQGPSSDVEPA